MFKHSLYQFIPPIQRTDWLMPVLGIAVSLAILIALLQSHTGAVTQVGEPAEVEQQPRTTLEL